jgi:hypothetical protein
METKVLNLIKSLENLQVTQNEQDWKLEITGNRGADQVYIYISLSVAPSLQSMLSRKGIVNGTLWIKVNGFTAVYESNMNRDEMAIHPCLNRFCNPIK